MREIIASFFPVGSADLPVYGLQVWDESFIPLRTSSSLQGCLLNVQMTDNVWFRPLLINASQKGLCGYGGGQGRCSRMFCDSYTFFPFQSLQKKGLYLVKKSLQKTGD